MALKGHRSLFATAAVVVVVVGCFLGGAVGSDLGQLGTCVYDGEVFHDDVYLPDCPTPKCVDFEIELGDCCPGCPTGR